MRALIVQQDHVSPPGPVGEALADAGYDVEEFLVVPASRFADPGVDVAFPEGSLPGINFAVEVPRPTGDPLVLEVVGALGDRTVASRFDGLRDEIHRQAVSRDVLAMHYRIYPHAIARADHELPEPEVVGNAALIARIECLSAAAGR